jgi:hypothetical protein
MKEIKDTKVLGRVPEWRTPPLPSFINISGELFYQKLLTTRSVILSLTPLKSCNFMSEGTEQWLMAPKSMPGRRKYVYLAS